MTHASLFSGIGGPEVAAAMLGWRNAFHCDINPFGRAVLEYWFPNSKSYGDIKKTNFTEWRGTIDVLTGGFPCQPFSYAGKRGGAQDDRYLWPEFKRVIAEIKPTWVIGENVAGIVSMVEPGEVTPMASQATLFDEGDGVRGYRYEQPFTIERVCSDLEGLGYSVQPILIPACAVGAPHRRDRVFIVARRMATDSESLGQFDRDRQGRGAVSGREYMAKTERGVNATECDGEPGHAADTDGECGQRMRFGKRESCESSQVELGRRSRQDGDERNATDPRWDRLARLLQRKKYGDAQWQGQIAQDITDHIRSVSPDNGRWKTFPSVSPVHRGNDGLPFDVDHLTLSFGKWRTEALKAYGNAIVPAVMYEIFRAIEIVELKKMK